MNVGEFFEKLSLGELSNLNIGKEGAGFVSADKESTLITYTNTALKALYSRFAYKKSYVNLELQEDQNIYELNSLYAVTDTTPDNNNTRYIKDTVANPFKDDVIKILAIQQQDDPTTLYVDETQQLSVNVHPDYGGIKLLSYNRFYVPTPVAGTILKIEYQATHPELSNPMVPSEQIELIPMLHEALEMRVAARVYSSMNGEMNLAKADTLMRRYEHLCLLIEADDLMHETESVGHDKLRDKGFI